MYGEVERWFEFRIGDRRIRFSRKYSTYGDVAHGDCGIDLSTDERARDLIAALEWLIDDQRAVAVAEASSRAAGLPWQN